MSKSMSGVNYYSIIPFDDLVFFIVGQFVAYLLLALVCWVALWGAEQTLFKKIKYPRLGVHFILLCMYFSVIVLSQFLYPLTTHPIEIPIKFNEFSFPNLVYFGPLVISAVFLILGTIKLQLYPRLVLIGVLVVFVLDAVISTMTKENEKLRTQETQSKNNIPNLIILGVDSYDYSKVKNIQERKGFIGDFLNQSVWFEDTLTPLARTYVAWISILTANYPVNSGIRYNLFPRELGNQSPSLLPYLKSNGYQTIYATDERRFANLDSYHGFEKVIGPPAGAVDFLLGGATDMPVNNIFMSTTLGQRFFPYSYANRAVAYSYDYENFLDLYSKELNQVKKDKPIFLATHLCLAHWPYYDRYSESVNNREPFKIYSQKIEDVNIMAENIFTKMKNNGLLKNAVVVLMSDHGEGWPERNANSLKPSSYGHGTDLLDEDQQKVMFAVQRFVNNEPILPAKAISYPASLIDVLPTLMGMSNIQVPNNLDGYDLSSLVQGTAHVFPEKRVRALETEIHVDAINESKDGNFDEKAVVAETAGNYDITNDGRFELKPTAVNRLLHFKERAIEVNGKYLHWSRPLGLTVYDSKTYERRPFDEKNNEDQQLKQDFCVHFKADIEQRFLGEVECN